MMSQTPKTVLFVDDEAQAIRYHMKSIEAAGYTVSARSDADSAFHWFEKLRTATSADAVCHLMVLDMTMELPKEPSNVKRLKPSQRNVNLTGTYLLEYFRSWNKATPVILFSQYSPETLLEGAWEVLCHGYSGPPLDDDGKRDFLTRHHRVWIRLKLHVSPQKLLELVRTILTE